MFAALVLMAACCTCSALLTGQELVVHKGSCPAAQAVFQWSYVYTLAGSDQASCWGTCAETANCMFAHLDTGKVCSNFLLADPTAARTDCDGRVGGPSGEFLLPGLVVQVGVSPHFPVGTRSFVDAITDAAPRIRDQFLSGNISPLQVYSAELMKLTSKASFAENKNSGEWQKGRGWGEEGLCCGYWWNYWALQNGWTLENSKPPTLGSGPHPCDGIYNLAMQKDVDIKLAPTVHVATASDDALNAALLGRDAIWTHIFEPIYTATFGKNTERITGYTAHNRFKAYTDLCNRPAPGLCPGERITIDCMGWDREPTFALPASLLVQLFKVGAGDVVNMAIFASMNVNTNADVDLGKLVDRVPPDSMCNMPASCADVAGLIGSGLGPKGSEGIKFGSKVVCDKVDKFLCPNQPLSLYTPPPTPAPVVPPVPAPVAAPPVPVPAAAPPTVPPPTQRPPRPPPDCGRRCGGWLLKNLSSFFEVMSEDCETVNGIPTREFWASISDVPDARKLLTASYTECMGVRPNSSVAKWCDDDPRPYLLSEASQSSGSSSIATTGSAGRVAVVAGAAVAAGVLALMTVAVVAKRRSRASAVESPEMLL